MPHTFGRFLKSFSAVTALHADVMFDLQKLMALQGLRGVVFKTRVDTGRARGNWQATFGAPADGETGRLDPSGGETLGGESAAILSMRRAFGVIYLTNNVAYIEVLEEKDHMVELTAAELQGVFG